MPQSLENTALDQNAEVDAAFFCSLGYGDDSGLRPSGPRLSLEQGCRIL
ncbi:hypothetical protein [Pseudomonas urmiensis]|jgi:3-hydroxypropanoate dehydrogenase